MRTKSAEVDHAFTCLSVVQQIFGRAKAYSEVAARPNPTTLDAVCACLEYDFDVVDELWKIVKKRSNKRKRGMLSLSL